MDDPRLTTLLERAYPPPRPELPSERVTSRAHALRRRRRVSQMLGAVVMVAAVVIGAVVINRGSTTTKVSVPPATEPHVVPDVTVDHALLVAPNTGLRDGQPIRVSGRNFVVGVGAGSKVVTPISLATCRAGATPANWGELCDSRTSAGTSEGDLRARTRLRKAEPHHPARANCCVDVVRSRYAAVRYLNLPGGALDCALERCVVIAVGPDRSYGVAPLRFDANTPPLPTPRVAVTPNTDLQEGQQVTVQIEDAWPGGADKRGASVSLCAVAGATPVCDQTDLGVNDLDVRGVRPIDGQGRATLTMAVKSTVLSDGVADCAQPPGCVIGVQVPSGPLGGQIAKLSVPITFSTDVSARPLADRLPHATIDPPGPYTDAQTVTITATGVPKGTAVGQCSRLETQPPGAGASPFLSCAPESVTTTGTLVLHRCAEPGRCALYLYITDTNRGGGLPPGALLEFAPLTVN